MKTLGIIASATAAIAMSGAALGAGHHHRARVVVITPPSFDPAWPVDYNIVPRYRYRPQDDRVDPYGKPVVLSEPEPGGSGIGQ